MDRFQIMAESKAIYSEPLVSEFDSSLPPPVVLVDPCSLSLAEREEMENFPAHFRFWRELSLINENGFDWENWRMTLTLDLNSPSTNLALQIMGIHPTKEVSTRDNVAFGRDMYRAFVKTHPKDDHQMTSCTWCETNSRVKMVVLLTIR